METRSLGWIFAATTLAVAGSACTLASPTHIDVQQPPDTTSSDATQGTGASGGSSAASGTGGASSVCSGFTKPDLTKLTACGGGKGHCYDKTKTPAPENFTACPDATMVCVPDEILNAGGDKLKSCTSVIGPGGCIDLAILNLPPDLKSQSSALKQDVCDPGLVCAPCTDPTHNNAPTPFCQPIGVSDKACTAAPGGTAGSTTPPAPSQGCCTTNGKSNGVCIAESAIPASQKNQVIADTCSTGNVCAPAAFVAGTPTKCSADLLGTGVCIDKCFNGLMSLAGDIGLLPNQGCGATEVCIACLFLSGQGVPGCN
jgi:hypothetical protein